MNTSQKYVIEFRSGSYFQNLSCGNGGPIESAKKFDSEDEAEQFMRRHDWILWAGGCAMPYNQ